MHKPLRTFLLATWAALLSSMVAAQNPQLQLKTSGQFPTVIFSAVRWNADPSYYSIAIEATGTATYVSAPAGLDRTGVRYTTEFQVSDRTRRIAFRLAQELNYFGDSYGESRSSPGRDNVYTAAYRYSSVDNQFTYSSSSKAMDDADLQELTSVFEELSQTFEYGRKLTELHAHRPRDIGPELDFMATKAERRALRDLPALAPILRSLADDSSLGPDVRKQAASLLTQAQTSGPPSFSAGASGQR